MTARCPICAELEIESTVTKLTEDDDGPEYECECGALFTPVPTADRNTWGTYQDQIANDLGTMKGK